MITNTKKDKYEELLYDVFKWGGLPQRFMFRNEIDKINYLTSVYDSIILKDIVDRLGIKDITSFNKVLQYMLDTETREFSRDNVSQYLKKEHHEIANDTLYNYLEALNSTFIMNKVYRYDIHGKIILSSLNKYYMTDLGIAKIKNTNKTINNAQCIKNIVYNELLSRGYTVYVGKTKHGEIDFIGIKNNETTYFQVTYYLDNEDVINREFGAFDHVKDNYEKIVLSLDTNDYSKNGIKHINILNWLLER